MKSKTMIMVTIGAFILSACDGCSNGYPKIGIYNSVGQAHFESITIKSGGKAEMVFMGSPAEVDYTVEDGKVKLTTAGQTQLLTITEDGCLDGGGFMGKYCIE